MVEKKKRKEERRDGQFGAQVVNVYLCLSAVWLEGETRFLGRKKVAVRIISQSQLEEILKLAVLG